MPEKDNDENLVFDYGECDNGAYILWNNDSWVPLVKNLSKGKTKCSLYFRKKESIEICNKYGNDSALCYVSRLGDNDYINMAYDHASANGVEDNNLRYIGSNPNNYIQFNCDEFGNNCEKWRIIGLINNIEDSSNQKNSYLKIIRDSIGNYSWDSSIETVNNGYGINEWSQADIENVLNNNYLNSINGGECFGGNNDSILDCPDWENWLNISF